MSEDTASRDLSPAAARAHRALAAFDPPDRATAVGMLSMYGPRGELTHADVAAVLEQFPGSPEDVATAGRSLLELSQDLADSPPAAPGWLRQAAGQDLAAAAPADHAPLQEGLPQVTVSAADVDDQRAAAVSLTATDITLTREELAGVLADAQMSADEVGELTDDEVREVVTNRLVDWGRIYAQLDAAATGPATSTEREFVQQCRRRVDQAFGLPTPPGDRARLEQAAATGGAQLRAHTALERLAQPADAPQETTEASPRAAADQDTSEVTR